MERLTTDYPQTNMETARNLFYIKDRETWVRGGGPEPDYEDVTLYDWVRRIIKTHGLKIDVSDNDILGDCLYERLFDCVDTVEGVVAHLYTAAWAFSELREKLKIYEDKIPFERLDETAALVKAQDEGPAAGDSVYVLERDECGEAVAVSGFMLLAVVGRGAILSPYIDDIEDLEGTIEDHIRETAENMSTDLYVYPVGDVYLTRAEAEAALGGGEDGTD